MNMKYKLLVILLFLSIFSNAQKVWDKETYAAMCKKHLNEVLAHTYELIIDGKLTAYYNDSFATKMPISELKRRFSDEYIANVGVLEGDDWVVDSLIVIPKDPRGSIVGFSSIQTKTSTILGINLLYPLMISGLNFGINPLCAIKWQDLKTVLSKQESEFIQATIQTVNHEGLNKYIDRFTDSVDREIDKQSSKLSKQNVYQIRIKENRQNTISTYWFFQYIIAANLASNNSKIGYKDANLNEPFDNLEKGLIGSAVIQISDYNLPDDPYAFKDTMVSVSYNWETEHMQCLKTPKGEYAIGFKADQLWFYMKLEDLLLYLPKEVLPSLELLKKER